MFRNLGANCCDARLLTDALIDSWTSRESRQAFTVVVSNCILAYASVVAEVSIRFILKRALIDIGAI